MQTPPGFFKKFRTLVKRLFNFFFIVFLKTNFWAIIAQKFVFSYFKEYKIHVFCNDSLKNVKKKFNFWIIGKIPFSSQKIKDF